MSVEVPPVVLEMFVQGRRAVATPLGVSESFSQVLFHNRNLANDTVLQKNVLHPEFSEVRKTQSLNLRNVQSRDGFKIKGKKSPFLDPERFVI